MTRSQAIVRSYLVLTGLFTVAASLMWAVNALFLPDAGLDIFEVFVVNAAFTVGLVLFEIPTGVVADSTGRRRSFLLSVFILIIGTVGYLSITGLGGGLSGFGLDPTGVDQLTAMVHGAFQQSLESLLRRGRDPLGCQLRLAAPRGASEWWRSERSMRLWTLPPPSSVPVCPM